MDMRLALCWSGACHGGPCAHGLTVELCSRALRAAADACVCTGSVERVTSCATLGCSFSCLARHCLAGSPAHDHQVQCLLVAGHTRCREGLCTLYGSLQYDSTNYRSEDFTCRLCKPLPMTDHKPHVGVLQRPRLISMDPELVQR